MLGPSKVSSHSAYAGLASPQQEVAEPGPSSIILWASVITSAWYTSMVNIGIHEVQTGKHITHTTPCYTKQQRNGMIPGSHIYKQLFSD